ERAPGALLQGKVHVPEALGGEAERDHLADAHDHVPGDDLGAGRRKLLEEPVLLQLGADLPEGLGLVLAEEDGEEHLPLLWSGRRGLASRGGVDEQDAEEGEGEESEAHGAEGSGVPAHGSPLLGTTVIDPSSPARQDGARPSVTRRPYANLVETTS